MTSEVATLIGDVLLSRGAPDRAELHARVGAALARVNHTHGPLTPLRITVGDEYQGAFAGLAAAARATLHLRVELLVSGHDARHGLGWGEVTVLQREPRVEDGPAWWAARDALHAVESAEQRPATSQRRTACRVSPASSTPDAAPAKSPSGDAESAVLVAWIESTLVLLDQMVGALTPRSVSVLCGLLVGRTQREIAERLEISPSAVSQRVRHDGLGAILAVDSMLEEV